MVDKENYNKLRQALLEEKKWPALYMFKFIVPNIDGKVDLVKELMPENGQLSFKHTDNLKYVSITCKVVMASPDQIISITQQVTSIKGVLAL